MDEPEIQFFLRTSIGFSRGLPFRESVKYLRGLLKVAGDQLPMDEVRSAFIHLDHADRQLELFAKNDNA